MPRFVTAYALIASLAAAIVIAGGGLALLLIENSGERGSGALLALCGSLAFVLAVILAVAPEGSFAGRVRGPAAIGAGILAALPVGILAFAAIRFARLPIGSPVPMLDWPILAAGLALGAGAVAILALGYRRSLEAEPSPIVHMQQIRHAQQQLRAAFESDNAAASGVRHDGIAEDEVRVRRV